MPCAVGEQGACSLELRGSPLCGNHRAGPKIFGVAARGATETIPNARRDTLYRLGGRRGYKVERPVQKAQAAGSAGWAAGEDGEKR